MATVTIQKVVNGVTVAGSSTTVQVSNVSANANQLNGATLPASWSAGQIPYVQSPTAFGALGIGAAGQFQRVNAAGNAPEWSRAHGKAALSEYDDIADAISTIGATPTHLVIDSDQTPSANVTFPSTCFVEVPSGVSIQPTSGTVVRFEGDVSYQDSRSAALDASAGGIFVVEGREFGHAALRPYLDGAGIRLGGRGRAENVDVGGVRMAYRDPAPRVAFIDDDGDEECYTTLYPILSSKGVPGATAVISAEVGDAGKMTQAQIQEMVDDGWEVLSHSTSATVFSSLTDAQEDAALSTSRSQLEALGFDVYSFVAPGGVYDTNTRKTLDNYYRANFRTQYFNASDGIASVQHPIDELDIWRVNFSAASDYDLADYKAFVDDAVANDGFVVFTIHSGIAAQFDATMQTMLGNLIDYIAGTTAEVVTPNAILDLFAPVLRQGSENWHDGEYFIVEPYGTVRSKKLDGLGVSGTSGSSTYLVQRGGVPDTFGTAITAIGVDALNSNTGGDHGTAVGYNAGELANATTATFIGSRAGHTNTGGSGVVAVGYQAGQNATAVFQTAIGSNAGRNNTGLDQTAIGREAGDGNTANDTVAIGYQSTTGGTGAVAIGHSANAGHAGSVALGYQSTTTAVDQVEVGARHFEIGEVSEPAAPAADTARLFVQDNGSGKTQLAVRFPTGATQVLATEP